MVALEGLENILKVGEKQKTSEQNEVATLIDEVDGVTKIQSLQYHQNEGTSRTFALRFPHANAQTFL